MTLDQITASAAAGITFKNDAGAGKTITTTWSGKPTITSTLATPQVDGVTADAFTYTTNAGMALTTGTVTTSNSTVQAFKIADAGILGINVTHSAKLASAITTTAIAVQQVTCLTIFTTPPAQYLCVLTDIATVSASNATTTYKVIHEVYSMDTAVLASANTGTAKALNDATNLTASANKASLMYKATSNTVTVGTEATLKGMD